MGKCSGKKQPQAAMAVMPVKKRSTCYLHFRYRLVSSHMRNPESTRETILKESGSLFNTQGYKATSISDITQATGFTKGAIYRHFRNKEELEKESLFYLSTLLFDTLRPLIKKAPTAGDKLRAVLRYFESYVVDSPIQGGCPLLNVAIEADDAHPALRQEAVRILQLLKDSISHILQKGIDRRQVKEGIDKDYYASLILGSLEGAIMMSKLRGDNEDMKRIIRHLEEQVQQIER